MVRIELFLVWESSCRNILDDLRILPEKLLEDIKVRIFLRKDTPADNRPPTAEWIELYHSFTTSPHASDTTLTAFLIKYFKDLAYYSDEESSIESSCEPVEFYFLVDSDTERKFDELLAILDQECKSKVKLKTINGQEEDIPKILGLHFCKACRKAFDDYDGLAEHDKEVHEFFCDNPGCRRSETRFHKEQELAAHKAQQTTCLLCHTDPPIFCDQNTKVLHMRSVHGQDVSEKSADHLQCDFCPKKVFSSTEQKDSHMRNTHKRCNCGCAVYFESRAHYLEHFYAVYPLACFENRKCPHRFQTVRYQAEHHRNAHNSGHPYYCVPCSTRDEDGPARKLGKTCAFKDEKSLRNHATLMKHTEEELFFYQGTSYKPTAKSSAINYC